MFCPGCGKQINDGAAFCPHCGRAISKPNASNTVQTPVNISAAKKPNKGLIAGVACAAVVFVIILIAVFSGGRGYEKKLVGSWYEKNSSYPAFTLYDDGTCEIAGEYGTGRWDVVNGDTLKLMNYYGQSETGKIDKVTKRELHLSDGDYTSVFYKR